MEDSLLSFWGKLTENDGYKDVIYEHWSSQAVFMGSWNSDVSSGEKVKEVEPLFKGY